MQTSTISPVAPQERIQTIDIIRAFALFGVVVVNFTVDNRGISPDEGRTGFFDQLAYWVIRFLLDDKAMAMYCFLFGLGFSIQLLRTQERNTPFLLMFTRRLISLFLIGIIAFVLTAETIPHEYAMVGVLLLLFYQVPAKFLPSLALLCVLVPFVRDLIVKQKAMPEANSTLIVSVDPTLLNSYTGVYRVDPTHIMVIIKKENTLVAEGPLREFNLLAKSDSEFIRKDGINAIYSFSKDSTGTVTKMIGHSLDGKIIFAWPKIQADLQQALKEQLQKRTAIDKTPEFSSYMEYIKTSAQKTWDRFRNWSWSDFLWGGNGNMADGSDIEYILPYFLIGLYAGRRRIFYNISSNRKFLKNVMWWGFIIGVAGMSIYLGLEAGNLINAFHWNFFSPVTFAWIFFSWSIGVMATAFAYIAGLALLLENSDWKKRLSFLAPVGRMGFTNYLLQAILYVCIFPCGFQLLGKIGPFYMMLLSFPVYVILIFLSHWWFKRFSIGPVEWLWRSLTYWKIQPMRLKPSDKSKEKETGNI